MKNKIKYLIKYNFLKKTKTKSFKIVNILLLILLIGLTNITTIIKSFGGDFDATNTIYVSGVDYSYTLFSGYYEMLANVSEDMPKYQVKKLDKEIDVAKEELKDTNDIVIVINYTNSKFDAEIISYDTINTLTYQIVYNALDSARNDIIISSLDISPEEKLALSGGLVVERTYLNESLDEYATAKETLGSVLIPIFIIPFFMLIIFLVQSIGADINEEKSTRGMEIIISSIPPKIHFFTKIIGSTLFVLMQGILLFVYGAIGLLIKRVTNGETSASITSSINSILDVLKSFGVLDHLVLAIVLIAILFIISFIAYALMAGILASMTTSIEDYQQLQGPIMIICVIGYYLAIMASVFEGSIAIKVASYVPFISAMLAPILFILGQTTLIDLLISIGLVLVVIFLLFKYGLRVYKIGILNYSSKDLWKKVFKSIKEK